MLRTARRPLSSRFAPFQLASTRTNLKPYASLSARPLVAMGLQMQAAGSRRSITTAPPSATSAAPVSGELSPIISRLQGVENRLESNSLNTLKSIQMAHVEVEKCRAQLEEVARVQRADGEAMKKAAGSQFLLSGFVLIYLFTICTWMLLLLTDLSGHMHGIPVVRMMTIKPAPLPLGAAAAGAAGERDPDLPVAPEDGLLDVNTTPEPHLAKSK